MGQSSRGKLHVDNGIQACWRRYLFSVISFHFWTVSLDLQMSPGIVDSVGLFESSRITSRNSNADFEIYNSTYTTNRCSINALGSGQTHSKSGRPEKNTALVQRFPKAFGKVSTLARRTGSLGYSLVLLRVKRY